MNGIGFWMKNARQVSLPQSMLPVLLAVGMSLRHDGFSLWLALVAAFGVGCAHLGMNLADDYFDYREGSAEKRTRLASDGIRARVAKYPYLSSGAASVRELVVAVCVFLGLAAGAGAVVVACWGVVPLALAGIGAVLGISYSGGPLRLGYRGLGEPVVGLLFGPLLMAGVQYAACWTVRSCWSAWPSDCSSRTSSTPIPCSTAMPTPGWANARWPTCSARRGR